ncbi:SDR family NAD(P)-dependent oxidoreductase [Actinocatenispora rupis]|uniref:Short-chain dehydrogenase/reductase n=1 Tax=Actinocatenispora rupis TaxID=519421 RepID=A0A8J3J1F5_9ACTN|nr:SDR family NAD(P)-dependent oxidoreductase [Actinocatenispora rupis]GID12795.1 short-chain dehydrogenase/reductase [Actinocatenispora rupis]
MVATVLTGVSRGLGRELFAALAARGDTLLAVGRGFTDEQRRAARAEPDRIRLATADLSVPEVPDVATFVAATDGPLALVHNAGSVEPVGAVGTLDAARVTATVHVNLLAPMLLTNALLAAATDRPVRVVFVSSGAARRVIGGWATYCATKAGGEMFFDAVAGQYAEDPRVSVANVNPGVMDTDMQALLRGSTDVYFPDRERYAGLAARGELPSPAEVAARIVAEHL